MRLLGKWNKLFGKKRTKKYLILQKENEFLKNPVFGCSYRKLFHYYLIYASSDQLQSNKEIYRAINQRKWNLFQQVKKRITWTMLILTLFVFIFSQLFIRKVVFQTPQDQSDEVYSFVLCRLKKVGPFYQLKMNLSDLSQELRSEFPSYAFIGLEHSGTLLKIVTNRQSELPSPKEEESVPGDLISKYDAIVYGTEVRKGINLVTINQVVKKGETLLQGKITDQYYVHPEGEVFGEVCLYEWITVPKTMKQYLYSGKSTSTFSWIFFSKNRWEKNSKYAFQSFYYENVFSLGNVLQIEKREEAELREEIITYDAVTAEQYAESLLVSGFLANRVSTKEKIISSTRLAYKEKENEYCFLFFTKYYRNIAEFRAYTISN